MNKKPVILRSFIALAVILVFAITTYPLAERDLYETFLAMVNPDKVEESTELIEKAKELQGREGNEEMYASQAILEVAKMSNLKEFIPENKNLEGNADVVNAIRKKASSSIRLGLDLSGGVEFIIKLTPDIEDEEQKKAVASSNIDYRDKAIEMLRKRLESNKIYEAEISPNGDSFITLKAPIVSKDEKLQLQKLIEMSAKLRFRLVHEDNDSLVAQCINDESLIPVGYELMTVEDTNPRTKEKYTSYFLVEEAAQMDGSQIVRAMPTRDNLGQRAISLSFNSIGAKDFAEVTTKYVGRKLAIVLDGQLYCAPVLNEPITGGQASISGSFSLEEMENISTALEAGNFPYLIEIAGVFDTDPKLGAESVKNGIYAGIIALIIVVIFMVIYYRVAGLIAVAALTVNVILVLGSLSAFDATLTLPGIAGIILTIGMAVDANVLIFERIREELKVGKNVVSAIELGYSKAFSAVLDANVTTLFIAIILMNVGTGPVKGFAITLSIGILTSLFTALFLTRLIFDYLTRFTNLTQLKMGQFIKNAKFDFLSKARGVMYFSLALIVMSIVLFAVKGEKSMGVDFTGGTQLSFSYVEKINSQLLEDALAKDDIKSTITYKSNSSAEDNHKLEVLIRAEGEDTVSSETVEEILSKAYPTLKLSNGNESQVGGLIGKEFTKSAIIAVLLSFLGIILYVSLRYEFSYAIAGVLALLHDVIIASGLFILFGREFSLSVIAALLTLIGYSINDTVVIFDRIRENVSLNPMMPYKDVVNLSINDTLNRTILTSVTTLFTVLVLFIFGGIAINDFVLVMMLGILVGTYSSVFIASPIVAVWHKKIGKQ